MVDDPQEIILEHLRAMRTDISVLKEGQRDLKAMMISSREDMNGLRGDILRQERAMASVEVDIDRIKTRLDLTDA